MSCEIRSVRTGNNLTRKDLDGKQTDGRKRERCRGKTMCRSRARGGVCLEGHVERTGRACLLWIHITQDL